MCEPDDTSRLALCVSLRQVKGFKAKSKSKKRPIPRAEVDGRSSSADGGSSGSSGGGDGGGGGSDGGGGGGGGGDSGSGGGGSDGGGNLGEQWGKESAKRPRLEEKADVGSQDKGAEGEKHTGPADRKAGT